MSKSVIFKSILSNSAAVSVTRAPKSRNFIGHYSRFFVKVRAPYCGSENVPKTGQKKTFFGAKMTSFSTAPYVLDPPPGTPPCNIKSYKSYKSVTEASGTNLAPPTFLILLIFLAREHRFRAESRRIINKIRKDFSEEP